MDIRSLIVFLSVADTLNFSRSGDALHLSVSAVSRKVARLEAAVGQPLLERDTRHMRLTAAGREFREYARSAVADWKALKRRLVGEEPGGEISLFCSVTASYSVLAPILAAFRVSHPAVEIMMHTGDQADGISRVLQGQDDIAVVSSRPGHLHSRLAFLPLLESPLRFCAPAADCVVRNTVLGAASVDWQQVPLIVPERGITKELLDQWLGERGIRPQIYAQVAGHEAIVAMASLGLGIGIAPQLVIEASGTASGVEVITLDDDLPTIDIGLCGLARRLESVPLSAFWAVARETYCEPARGI